MSGSTHPRPRLALAVLCTFILAWAACTGGPDARSDEPDPDGEITTNLGGEPDTIDPHIASFSNEIAVIMKVFEGLMTLNPETLKPEPAAAAREPEVSSDGLRWKFTLREGLKFSDGSPLTSRDFAFGFKRSCDPRVGGDQYGPVLFVIVGCEQFAKMDPRTSSAAQLNAARDRIAIATPSEREIEFTLRERAPYFASIAYLWVGMPVKESEVTRRGDKWTEPPSYIGNGPFKLVEWRHSDKLVYERNEHYRRPVKLKRWTNVMIAEGSTAFAAYRNDELDVVGVAAEDLRAVEGEPELQAQAVDVASAATYYYGFNVRRAPFNELNVRLAFAKSFDREAYVRDVQKIGRPALGGFIPPGIPGHDTDDTAQKFDPAEAKRLLDTASPAAKEALRSLKFSYAASTRTRTRVEWVQQQWKQNLGVEVQLDPVDRTAISNMLKRPETTPQLFQLGWIADFPDEQNWYTTVWLGRDGNSSSRTGYQNAEFDRLVREADKELDAQKRAELYKQAGRLLSKDAPAAWLFYDMGRYLKKPWVRGVINSPLDASLGQFRVYDVYVTKKR